MKLYLLDMLNMNKLSLSWNLISFLSLVVPLGSFHTTYQLSSMQSLLSFLVLEFYNLQLSSLTFINDSM
jgi:hypothetical protein